MINPAKSTKKIGTTNTWQSPAKINLFLHVLSRRRDGYHNLQTIFQLIDYCDTLTFKVRNDGKIIRTKGNTQIDPDDDLVLKSAKYLKQSTQTKLGAEIAIDKKIPIGGGLGGGSSNAATVLVALNQLWQTQLSQKVLKILGLKLGADVPFFIHNHTAWAEGVGNKLSDLQLPNYWYLVVHPRQNIHTQAIFNHPHLGSSPTIKKITTFAQLQQTRNDCLKAAIDLCPEIAKVLNWFLQLDKDIPHWQLALPQGLSCARMSGTGSSIFIGADDYQPLVQAQKICPSQWQAFVAPSLTKKVQ